MRCPFCKADNDRVIDSRASEESSAIRRRRECLSCGRRYTTYERVEEHTLKIVKKDGAREPFSREKMRKGVEIACWKRPVSDDQVDRVISAVENHVYANFDMEVESQVLGGLVMEELREIDQVAYVRFASVYREFTDVRDFVDELRPMLNSRPPRKED